MWPLRFYSELGLVSSDTATTITAVDRLDWLSTALWAVNVCGVHYLEVIEKGKTRADLGAGPDSGWRRLP